MHATPVNVAEVAPSETRGMLVSAKELAIVVGMLQATSAFGRVWVFQVWLAGDGGSCSEQKSRRCRWPALLIQPRRRGTPSDSSECSNTSGMNSTRWTSMYVGLLQPSQVSAGRLGQSVLAADRSSQQSPSRVLAWRHSPRRFRLSAR